MSTSILAAVGAAIAGTASMAVNAASYSIHISGASAQRTFWESDLEAIAGGTFGSELDGGGVRTCTLTKTNASLVPAIPDIHALVCNISSNRGSTPPALPTGVNAGDTITLYYEAEFGSVWGIAPFVPGSVASTRGRMELVPQATPPSTDVTVANTTFGTGYSRDLDTCGGCSALQGPVAVDIGVADMDPIFWASTDNWSYSDGYQATDANGPPTNTPATTCSALYPGSAGVTPGIDGTGYNCVINVLSIPGQGQPTLAQLQTLEQTWTEINGQVFSVVVDKTAAPTNGITNLSSQSIRSILTGNYKTWSQVPEVGNAGDSANTSIVVCRRDHGSGSQVSMSTYFTQTECGGNNGTNGTGSGIGSASRVVSQFTSPQGKSTGNLDQSVGVVDGVTMNPAENLSTNDVKQCLSSNSGKAIGIISLGAPSSAYTTLTVDGVEANAHNGATGTYKYAFTTWGFNNTANTQGGTAAQIASRLFSDAQKPSNSALPQEGGTITAGIWHVGSNTPQAVYAVQDGLNAAPTLSTATGYAAEFGNPSRPVQTSKSNKAACTILINDNK